MSISSRIAAREEITVLWSPKERRLAGRVIAVRVRHEAIDLTIYSVYCPPNYRKTREEYDYVMKKVVENIAMLPGSTTPVMLMDGNAHVGRIREEGGNREGEDLEVVGG